MSDLYLSPKFSNNLHIWLMSAMFFFVVLSWYNAGIEIFDYIFSQNGIFENTSNFFSINENLSNSDQNLKKVIGSVGFAILWTFISFMVYFFRKKKGYFLSSSDQKHPILREDFF